MALSQSFNVDASGNEVISGAVSITNFPGTQAVSGTVALSAGASAIGSVTVSNFPATQAVTGSFFQATQPVSIAGTVAVTAAVAATGTITSVAGAAVSTTLLVSNASRKGFSIFNDSTSILKVAFAATASATAFSFLLQPSSFFESGTLYTGIVTGIWASAVGNARVTELT